VGYDHMNSDDDDSLDKKGVTLNVAYLPWLNTKLALEYSNFRVDDGAGGDQTVEQVNFLVHLYL
jgi:hypothetical protein